MSRLTGIRSALAVSALIVGAASAARAFSPTQPHHGNASFNNHAIHACGARPFANPYYTFPLDPARATGASGIVRVSFSDSPFGVAMSPDGHYTYSLDISTTGLPKLDAGNYVVWATPPNLNPIVRLGTLGSDGRLLAQVDLNKFIMIISAETTAKSARWSDPIMLRGISRSSLMHSFMGHGPFEGPC